VSTLSVVVTTHDGRAVLGECLEALLAQTRTPDELLVVDDASAGGSDAGFVHERFPRVRTLSLPRNLGHAGAAAAGVAATKGAFVALVNNDGVPDPDWCEQALRPFVDPHVGSVATRLVRYDDPSTIDSAGGGFTVVGHAYKRLEREPDPREGGPRPVFSACAAAAIYRREAYEDAGGLRAELVAYYDDVDLGFRLRLAGWICVYEPKARCRHRGAASYGRDPGRRLALVSRNATFVYWANLPAPLLARRFPEHALFFALQIASRVIRGQLMPFLAGKIAALVGFRTLLRLRGDSQARRRVGAGTVAAALETRWLQRALHDLRKDRRSRPA
jgi:O-antigen biosynthesis protein